MKKILSIVLSLLVISLIIGCGVKKETKPTAPVKQDANIQQPAITQDTATTIDKDIEEIDTGLSDTASIDSGLDDLDQDLATI